MKKGLKKFLDILEKNKKVTDFQKRVYKAVLQIPKGKTRSYKWVARKIGNPKSCRAVAQALKKNPYTIAVPCHRVIKEDGSLGGYSKGTEMKMRLLKKEKAM